MKLLSLLCIATTIILLAGCSDESSTSSETSTSATTTAVTTTAPATTTVTTTTTPPPTTTAPPATVATTPTTFSVPAGYDPALFTRDAAFESNIAFIGDSICSGFKVYPILPANQVFAEKNIRTDTIYNYTFSYNNGKYSIVDCIGASKPKVAYIWMGINGINFTSKEAYANNMINLVQKLKAVSPQTKFIIMSMSPTTASHAWQANSKIQACNNYTENVLKTSYPDIGFANIYNILADQNGNLLSIYAAKDGVHLQSKAYTRILSYLAYGK